MNVPHKHRNASWLDVAESAADISREGVPDVEMDVEGVLEADDGPVLMFGDSGSFKSWIALFMSAAILSGSPFLGRATRRRSHVLYVNLDGGVIALKRRVAELGVTDSGFIVVSPPDGWDATAFEELLATYPRAFVVIDCLADAFQPDPSADVYGAQTRTFLKGLRTLYGRYGCNGIVIDHARRNDGGRGQRRPRTDYIGSHQKRASVRQMWAIDRIFDDDDRPTNTARLICEKTNEAEPFSPIHIEFDFSAGRVGIATATPPAPSTRKISAVEREMTRQVEFIRTSGPATRKQLGADNKGSSTHRAALDANLAAGRLALISESERPGRFDLPERIAADRDQVCDRPELRLVTTSPNPRETEVFS